MSDDDAKRAVLARRARFVAAAMAGIATASCDKCSPQPCLSARPVGVDASPMPCLSAPPTPVDAGEQTAIDDGGADAADAGDGGKDGGRDAGKRVIVGPPAPPHPCLSAPRVCLEPPF